ncbi:hypothetical protein DAHU10_035430 [Hanseniaspora uvarum]|nr:hypothetical protein DAHU10_035430 [Hanseniaspora uvarum]
MQSIYDFSITLPNGTDVIPLSTFKGKYILIVNVASKCSFNAQLFELQSLYSQFKDNLVVIGIPCNQFGKQEPLPNDEIIDMYKSTFGTEFILSRVSTVNGKNELPLYTFLKNKKKGLLGINGIKWNFEKFLVNREGEVTDRYSTNVTPRTIAKKLKKMGL